jgi:hypothetical protein
MKAAATNAPMFARATEALMSRLPTVNGYKRPSPRLSTYSLISHEMLFAYDRPLCHKRSVADAPPLARDRTQSLPSTSQGQTSG